MRLNKVMLVGIFLLAILTLGAVSAQEGSSADVLAVDSASSPVLGDGVSYDKTIYVNTTGDDSNSGSQTSPYATINKGISSVNASDNAVIYLSEGTFTGDNNTDLSINLAHKNYNGSLTFIGQGYDKTFIDGEQMAPIFKSMSGDSIIVFKNIAFINGKANTGGAITSNAVLTIDNCLFEDNYATGSNGGAIYQRSNDFKVTNSIFRNNSVNSYGGSIFASSMQNAQLMNCVFENSIARSTYCSGAGAYIDAYNSTIIKNNRFVNISTSGNAKDAALYANSGYNGNGIIVNNTFINCNNKGQSSAVININGKNFVKGNAFVNSTSASKGQIFNGGSMNVIITFLNNSTTSPTFKVSCRVTDVDGNNVSGQTQAYNGVTFYINGEQVGQAAVTNGLAVLSLTKLVPNGDLVINGTWGSNNVSMTPGILSVNIDQTPIDLWVDGARGSDLTGDGSKLNPFKTIGNAITYGFGKSLYPTIHIMGGVYSGVNNTNLTFSNLGNLTLVGEGYNKVLIDGQNRNWFLKTGSYTNVVLKNLTYKNGSITKYISGLYSLITTNAPSVIEDCIISDNVNTYGGKIIDGSSTIDNLTFCNNTGMITGVSSIDKSYLANNKINNAYNLYFLEGGYINITNSVFENNFGLVRATQQGISINNKFINNTGSLLSFILSKNDYFKKNNGTAFIGFSNTYNNYKMLCDVINSTFIDCFGDKGGAIQTVMGSIVDCTFINNSANYGGAIYLAPHYTSDYYSVDSNITLTGCIFKDNTAVINGKDIYIEHSDNKQYVDAKLTNLTITFNNLTTQFLADTVSMSVSHISGAVIGGGSVKFYLNGTYMGTSEVVNGIASLDYLGFKNGTYTLSGDYVFADASDKIINGTVKVALKPLKNNVTVYVSDKLGDDVNGDGSLAKPFKTIKKALNYGYSQSSVLFIHVLEGIYSGEGNTNIELSSTVSVTITGAGVNKTILCGNQTDDFFTIAKGSNIITIENMSMVNGSKADASAVYPYQNVKNIHSPIIALPGSNVHLNNIYFENNKGTLGGAVLNSGNMIINNCSFVRNGFSSYGGGLTNNGTLIVNNSYFFANYAYRGSNIFVIKDMTLQNSLVEEAYWWSGSHYGNIVGIDAGITLINTTIQDLGRTSTDAGRTDIQNKKGYIYLAGLNRVESYGCIFRYNESIAAGDIFGSYYGSSAEYNWQNIIKFDNCTFININNINNVGFRPNLNRSGNVSLNNCIIDIKGKVLTTNAFGILNITNCYIVNPNAVSWTNLGSPTTGIIDLNNNWWGNNTQPVFTVVDANRTLVNMTPDTWLVLTLDVTNNTGLLQDAVLAFKVFNGTNLTDYNGSLPLRNFNMSMINGALSIANGTIANNVVNGFEAKEGNYTISATVDGQSVTYNGVASIGKGIIEVNDVVADYGDVVIANATLMDAKDNPLANVNVTLKVNGKTYTLVTDENGTVSFVIGQLNAGKYTLVYSVSGSKVISDMTNSSTLTVNKAKDSLKVDVNVSVAGEDSVINVVGPKDATGNVTVLVNGKSYNVILVNGSAKLTIKDLAAGNYNVTVTYSGDKNYEKQVIRTNFTVDINKKVNLNISDIVMIYKDGTRMVAVLTDYLGNPIANATVYFTINGQTYAKTTDANGTASMGLNLVSNIYNAAVSYNGSDMYNAVSKNITVTINPTIVADDLVKMYQNATRFYAKFTDSTGKALANTEVKFNIHGVFYTKKTDKDGMADLGIMLRPGSYILTAYNPVTGEEKGFNITVKSLIMQNDLTKYYLNASKFEATVYNKDGSLAVNKNVTFNINGVFYTKTTDKNGVASLGIALRPGNYTITTMYDGLDIGNKVTVLPTLVTKDLSMKYRDGSNFTALTLDGQGKPLANQNVSFNVNGVFYHKVTNKDGIASLGIRLMSGEYIITSYWNDFQTGNTIKISP